MSSGTRSGPSRIDGPGATAFLTVAARAHESRRPDRLFDDFLAPVLGGPEIESGLNARAGRLSLIELRTRYYDDWLLEVAATGIRQVVLVAAGFDARAFRLDWPGRTRVFELDRRASLALKQRRLDSVGATARCRRITVAANLALGRWPRALREAGFNPDRRTAWLIEGLVYYLPPDAVPALLRRIAGLSAPGSVLGMDCTTTTTLLNPLLLPGHIVLRARGAPWRFGTNHPERLLEQTGWDTVRIARMSDADVSHGRWPPPGVPRWVPLPTFLFTTAARHT